MKNALRALAIMAAVAGFAPPAAAVTIFPAIGAPGDGQWDDHCPSHQFLIGLRGRAGLALDQMQIVCAPMLANGTHGTKYYGPARGGSGGTVVEQSCPNDAVANGISIFIHPHNLRPEYVVGLTVTCRRLSGSNAGSFWFASMALQNLRNLEADSVVDEQDQQCPSGETGSGINGHSGKNVNAVGLDCAIRTQN